LANPLRGSVPSQLTGNYSVIIRKLEAAAGIDNSQPIVQVFTNKIMSNTHLSKVVSPEWTLNVLLDKGCVDGRTSLAGEASLGKSILRN